MGHVYGRKVGPRQLVKYVKQWGAKLVKPFPKSQRAAMLSRGSGRALAREMTRI
jgi:hypothetical protein